MDEYEVALTKDYILNIEHLCFPVTSISEDFTLMDFFTLIKNASNEHAWLLNVLGYPTW
jgi:hypothetical protein